MEGRLGRLLAGFFVFFWVVLVRVFWGVSVIFGDVAGPFRPYGGSLFSWCMDRTHGGQVYGDMVDTLSPAIRVVEIDGSQLVATEVDVEVIRSLLARPQGHDMSS